MANKTANVMLIEELGFFFLATTNSDNFISGTSVFCHLASIVNITPLPIPEEPDMTIKRPLCHYNGEIEELRTTDFLPGYNPLSSIEIESFEPLSAGNFINVFNDSGAKCRKADASEYGKEAHGYVLTSASGSESIVVYFDGINDQLSGLIPGPLFLSTTPGLCSSTSASGSGNIVQRLGLAISETTMNFKPQAIILLE